MGAYIAARNCTEKGVCYGMHRNIGIRMADKTPSVIDAHTAKYYVISIAKCMHIEAVTYAKITDSVLGHVFCSSHVVCSRDFKVVFPSRY